MDSFLSFMREFTGLEFLFWFLIGFIYEAILFIRVRKILGKEFKGILVINKSNKNLSVAFDIIIYFIIILGIILFIKTANPYLFISFFLILLIKIIHKKFAMNIINYNEKGFTIMEPNSLLLFHKLIRWEDVISLYWDKDFGQKSYGLNFKCKVFKKPFKLWVLRENREKINEVFRQYNVPIKNI